MAGTSSQTCQQHRLSTVSPTDLLKRIEHLEENQKETKDQLQIMEDALLLSQKLLHLPQAEEVDLEVLKMADYCQSRAEELEYLFKFVLYTAITSQDSLTEENAFETVTRLIELAKPIIGSAQISLDDFGSPQDD